MGNAFVEPLLDIWKRMEGSLMFRMMKREGFSRLYEIVEERSPELFEKLPSLHKNRGACSLCNSIFSNPQLTAGIKEVFSDYESERISDLLAYLAETYDADTMKSVTMDLTGGQYGQLS